MQNLKQTLADRGLTGNLLLRENGAQIPLRFEKGQTRKVGKLTLGAAIMDVEFVLEEIPGAPAEHPNLRLVIQTGPAPKVELADTLKVQTAAVEEAARKEAEATAEARKKAAETTDTPAPTTTTNTSAAATTSNAGADKPAASNTTNTSNTGSNTATSKPQNNGGFKKGN